jgi:hypothetical protein
LPTSLEIAIARAVSFFNAAETVQPAIMHPPSFKPARAKLTGLYSTTYFTTCFSAAALLPAAVHCYGLWHWPRRRKPMSHVVGSCCCSQSQADYLFKVAMIILETFIQPFLYYQVCFLSFFFQSPNHKS